MAILKLKGFSQPKKSCKQTHAHVKGKKAGQEHFLSEKMRRNSGQPIECNSDSDMHVACSMHMAILETERVSHNPIEVLQADSCTC